MFYCFIIFTKYRIYYHLKISEIRCWSQHSKDSSLWWWTITVDGSCQQKFWLISPDSEIYLILESAHQRKWGFCSLKYSIVTRLTSSLSLRENDPFVNFPREYIAGKRNFNSSMIKLIWIKKHQSWGEAINWHYVHVYISWRYQSQSILLRNGGWNGNAFRPQFGELCRLSANPVID